jgi:protein-tyrosine phosphatase
MAPGRAAALAALLAIRLAGAGAISHAACEQTGANSYRISFEGGPANGDIAIYASSRADRIDTQTPLVKTRKSPVEVTVPGTGRVYFHLKPPSGPARVVSVRRLPLEGALNFRDLGGYPTADGRHVKWGLVYRTGKFDKLTEKDYQYVAGLGIETACDFRMDWERQQAPTKWPGVPRPTFLVNPIDSYTRPAAPAGGTPQNANSASYWWLDVALEQFALAFRHIARGSLPMVFHCSAGKDRTGVMAALLLGALGVPRETIMADYLLTNTYLVPDSKIPELAAAIQKRQNLASPPDPDTVRAMSGGVNPRSMQALFQLIDEKYKSVDVYLRDVVKLTPAELAALRSRLLEP